MAVVWAAARLCQRGLVQLHYPRIKEADMVIAANGVWLWTTLAIIVWIALAFWPARVAARKGHSFIGFFLLSILFFPLALIVAYMVGDRTTNRAALA
jgi:hypothetical protein